MAGTGRGRARTYAELATQVPTAGAIVDATFRSRQDRDAFRDALGADAGRRCSGFLSSEAQAYAVADVLPVGGTISTGHSA